MKNNLEFVIITGLSGAGKSEAIKCFEDMGYFCIDNLPAPFMGRLAELCALPGSKIDKVALVSDIRGGESFDSLFRALEGLKKEKVRYMILFLEASDEALLKRFKETRRKHPLAQEGRIVDGIKRERRLLQDLRGRADAIINTSNFQAYQLKEEIRSSFLRERRQKGILVTVISFGYKYGIPMDADLVIDVRFLPNPHYVKALKDLTGKDEEVRKFVLERRETKSFLRRFLGLLSFLMPHYFSEGKTHLTIALGCTGGAHRSVVLAEETAKFLRKKGYDVFVRHRDVGKRAVALEQR